MTEVLGGEWMARILIVEDEDGLRKGITLTLRREGYETDPACCIREAEGFLREQSYELVICDIMLPDGGGLDFGEGAEGNRQLPDVSDSDGYGD